MNGYQKKFLIEFRQLLAKYKADISAADHWEGYAECGQDIRLTIYADCFNYLDIEFKFINEDSIKALLDKENEQEEE
jgi:hypothetical protein